MTVGILGALALRDALAARPLARRAGPAATAAALAGLAKVSLGIEYQVGVYVQYQFIDLALAGLVATTAVPRWPGQGLPASLGLLYCEKRLP